MKVNSIEIPNEMSEEAFEKLAEDMEPVIKAMEDVLKKHGIEGIASLDMSADTGYFTFDLHCTKWRYTRSDDTSPAKISFPYSKEV